MKSETLRFRARHADKARLARLAKMQRRTISDMARIVLEDFLTAEEKRLNLPPLTPAEAQAYLEAFSNSTEGAELAKELSRILPEAVRKGRNS